MTTTIQKYFDGPSEIEKCDIATRDEHSIVGRGSLPNADMAFKQTVTMHKLQQLTIIHGLLLA